MNTVITQREATLYRHLLHLLGAKDHDDAARIIAEHHARECLPASAPEPVAWPVATGSAKEGGWTIDFDFIQRVRGVAEGSFGYSAGAEETEATLLAALQCLPNLSAPPAPRSDDAPREMVPAADVFRMAGGDTEGNPRPTAAEALHVLRDLRERHNESLDGMPSTSRADSLGKVPGCGDCEHNGRYLCDEHGPRELAGAAAVREAWRIAIRLGNNICVQESDRENDNDGDQGWINGTAECAKRIRGYEEPDDAQLVEMLTEGSARMALAALGSIAPREAAQEPVDTATSGGDPIAGALAMFATYIRTGDSWDEVAQAAYTRAVDALNELRHPAPLRSVTDDDVRWFLVEQGVVPSDSCHGGAVKRALESFRSRMAGEGA